MNRKIFGHLPIFIGINRVKFSLFFLLFALQSCSTAMEDGRCKKIGKPSYVAASKDTDGKKWEIRVTPNVADLKCDGKTTVTIPFSAFVVDGQGFAKPGLAVKAYLVSSSADSSGSAPGGFVQNPDQDDDIATDACGVAVFKVRGTCPEPKKSSGGFFYVTSGPLSSEAIKVTLENVVQDQTTIITSPAK